MSKAVKNTETIARYLFSKNEFRKENLKENITPKVKYNAFMPPKKHPTEISVYRIDNLPENEIWDIGQEYIGNLRNKEVLARGNVKVSNIIEIIVDNETHLQVIEDKKPHPLHANIKNIPAIKALQKNIAQKLSKITKLVVK